LAKRLIDFPVVDDGAATQRVYPAVIQDTSAQEIDMRTRVLDCLPDLRFDDALPYAVSLHDLSVLGAICDRHIFFQISIPFVILARSWIATDVLKVHRKGRSVVCRHTVISYERNRPLADVLNIGFSRKLKSEIAVRPSEDIPPG